MNSKALSTSQPYDFPCSVWDHLEKSSDSRDLNDLKVSLYFSFLNKLFSIHSAPRIGQSDTKQVYRGRSRGMALIPGWICVLHPLPSSYLPRGILIIIRIIMSVQKDKTQIGPIPYLLKSFLGRLKLGNICILNFSIPFNKVKIYA